MAEVKQTGVEYEKVEDKSVYWTASFYVSAKRIPRCILDVIRDRDALGEARDRDAASKQLSEAMEPLFNDISDRERAGKIDDTLFAAGGGKPEWIDIVMPRRVRWTTEGVTTTASPDDLAPEETDDFTTPATMDSRRVRVRRFWYVHRNGAVSWHVSFLLNYGPNAEQRAEIAARGAAEDDWHDPGLLYFLSRLQKVLAPKEFRRDDDKPVSSALRVHTGEQTHIAPIDETRIVDGGVDGTFWTQMARWFGKDSAELFGLLNPHWKDDIKAAGPSGKTRLNEIQHDAFDALIGTESYLEVPQLRMPRLRYMFFFVDKTFFDRLLPPLDPETRRTLPRVLFVNEACYAPFAKMNEMLEEKGEGGIWLDKEFWRWTREREDVTQLLEDFKAKAGDAYETQLADYKKDKLAWRSDRRVDCLNYLFLSGFNQNIIDFMAQDASEILDSIDPIYPEADDDSGERFFVRFATPRAFITYVSGSRSLEAGNDYIGACPYAFLIHVLALHNEYLARDYEIHAEEMIEDIRVDNEKERPSRAVQRFFGFRMGEFSDYARNRYGKVFRYDTEAKVFSEIEQRRGIERKTDYLDTIVENMEKQTEDLQSRLQKREDRVVTFAVGGVGVFGLFSFVFDVTGPNDDKPLRFLIFPEATYAQWMIGLSVAIVAVVLWIMSRDALEYVSGWFSKSQLNREAGKEWTLAEEKAREAARLKARRLATEKRHKARKR